MEFLLCDFRAANASLQLSIAKFAPRKLVLINAKEGGQELVAYCRDTLGIKDIEVAHGALSLIAGSTVKSIKINEEAYNELKFEPVGEYEIAYISGNVECEGNQLLFNLQQVENARNLNLSLGALCIGQLKDSLEDRGFHVEFREGKLLINDKVVVCFQGSDQGVAEYLIEGVLCQEYFDIRNYIYSQQLFI